MHLDCIENVTANERIGRTSFHKTARVLTAADQKAKKAVNYMSGILLYGNFDRLHQVASTSSEKEILIKITCALECHMKAVLGDHMSTCNVAHADFAFSTRNMRERKCEMCSVPRRTTTWLKTIADPQHNDLLNDTE